MYILRFTAIGCAMLLLLLTIIIIILVIYSSVFCTWLLFLFFDSN